MRFTTCLVSLLVGCLPLSSPKPDGQPCSTSEACESGECLGGICVGGDCAAPGGHDCGPNFACVHDDGDPIFGIGDGNFCELLCSPGCPAQFACSGTYCNYVGPQVSIASSPLAPQAGETVHLTATLAPDLPATFTWRIGQDVTVTGQAIDHVFTAGDWGIEVDAKTASADPTADAEILVCAVAGQSCDLADCCSGTGCSNDVCQ